MAEQPHKDHRSRLRERFLAEGLQHFEPHVALELLLFYSIPRRDTNEIAHRLIERFGSLPGVLEAPCEELCKVEGVGENSAVLCKLAAQLAKRYLTEQNNESIELDSTDVFRNYVKSLFVGVNTEVAYMLCLNNAGRLLQSCAVSLGTKYAVSLDNRTLLETAFRYNATKIVLAHNHPNGLPAPSRDDVQRTKSAVELFRSVQIRLVDHLIVADGECFSMAANPRCSGIFLNNLVPLPAQQAADLSDET